MADTIEVNVKGIEMQVEHGQGVVQLTIGPASEKTIRAIAAVAAGGTLRIIVSGEHDGGS